MRIFIALFVLLAAPLAAHAQNPWDMAKGVAGKATTNRLEKEINDRLIAEGRKNQCAFKTDSDQFQGKCTKQMANLAKTLIDAKKKIVAAGLKSFKFEVSGHTDSSGDAAHNKELSGKRAAVIVKELVKRGVPQDEIVSVGKGADEPLVKPDDTPAKKAKNRRYELRVRL